ncbi:MAG: ABC transporter ATP-binding protein [Candidatus Moranbacteria bacterium]|nr:ABC transporter ATP-binding protein [Candidatus Moranbacteria bacterium]
MSETLINIRGVTKKYASSDVAPVAALNGVDLEIYRGEFVVITGASGSGKSTLLNLLGLLDDPTSGEIQFNGQNIHTLNEMEKNRFRLETISFVFQFFNLIDNYTAAENISFQLELQGMDHQEARKKAIETLRYLQLEGKADLYPQNLSGGEQQRVAIGRALAKDSLVIIADEPTAHLDSRNAQIVMDILRHINTTFKRTIILVTHEPNQAEQADRQIIIHDGRVSAIKVPDTKESQTIQISLK